MRFLHTHEDVCSLVQGSGGGAGGSGGEPPAVAAFLVAALPAEPGDAGSAEAGSRAARQSPGDLHRRHPLSKASPFFLYPIRV